MQCGVTVNGHSGDFFWGWWKSSKLKSLVMVVQLCKYTKMHWTIYIYILKMGKFYGMITFQKWCFKKISLERTYANKRLQNFSFSSLTANLHLQWYNFCTDTFFTYFKEIIIFLKRTTSVDSPTIVNISNFRFFHTL